METRVISSFRLKIVIITAPFTFKADRDSFNFLLR